MLEKHPSLDIMETKSSALKGKRIVLAITGSVGAVKSLDTARQLMRHGAKVYPVMTKAATELIHPDLLHWGTGEKVITKLTGAVEHVALVGNVEGKADLLLIAPATANTIGKIACGIDDTVVTTCATTAIGEGIPVMIVPAMHKPMYEHPIVKKNLEILKSMNISILQPRVEEGKAKIPEAEDILTAVLQMFEEKPLQGKRFLVSAGRTVEYIDPIRVLSNNASGKMGIALALAAKRAGADVCLVHGKISVALPEGIHCVCAETATSMYDTMLKEAKKSYDVIISAAAVNDWMPKTTSDIKISTHSTKELTLVLVPTPKIIDKLKSLAPQSYIVAFRALQEGSIDDKIENAKQRMRKASADMIALNDVGRADRGFETETNELYVISKSGDLQHIPLQSKKNAAMKLIQIIAQSLQHSNTETLESR